MAWKQLVIPNYSVQGKAGWCLWVQQEVYSVPHLYLTAKDAWDAAQFKHPGERPPEGIHALCYWTYTESGIPYWHVATRHPNLSVFSSPFDYNYGAQWYGSIDAMTARIRKIDPTCTYVGWAEDLSNVRLVEGEDMKVTANNLKYLYLGIYAEDVPEAKLANDSWVGKDYAEATQAMLDYANRNGFAYWQVKPQLETKIAELNKAVDIKDTEIKKLTAQLAVQSGDTQLLNGFGVWLTKMITRLGMKG